MLKKLNANTCFNMKSGTWIVISFLFVLFFSSCSKDCDEIIDTSNVNIEVSLVRLETEYKSVKSVETAKQFLEKHAKFTKYNLMAGKPKEQVLKDILWLGKSPIDTLLSDVTKMYGDFATEEQDLTGLFKNIKVFYPEFEVPEINTMVSAFGSYIVEDGGDVLLIGLDYFLDSTATYLPPKEEIPDYMRRHLRKDKITIHAARKMADRFIQISKGSQLINQMILHGKRYYFAHRMLPCKSENEIVDYTPVEWQEVIDHEYSTYAYFTKNELFYSTKAEKQRLYVNDSPKCPSVGDNCPGRIGRWLGYQIVKSYVENNELTLQELMAEENHTKIFTQSGYKPTK